MSNCFSQASAPGDGRQSVKPQLSEEQLARIQGKIDALLKDFGKQTPFQQYLRYQEILDLGKQRGWVHDLDPERDRVRVRCIEARMDELVEEMKGEEKLTDEPVDTSDLPTGLLPCRRNPRRQPTAAQLGARGGPPRDY